MSKKIFQYVNEKEFIETIMNNEMEQVDNFIEELNNQVKENKQSLKNNENINLIDMIDDGTRVALLIALCFQSSRFKEFLQIKANFQQVKIIKESFKKQKAIIQRKDIVKQIFQKRSQIKKQIGLNSDHQSAQLFDFTQLQEEIQNKEFVEELKQKMFVQMEEYDKLYYEKFLREKKQFSFESPFIFYYLAQQENRNLCQILNVFQIDADQQKQFSAESIQNEYKFDDDFPSDQQIYDRETKNEQDYQKVKRKLQQLNIGMIGMISGFGIISVLGMIIINGQHKEKQYDQNEKRK
eukprot:403368619